MNQFNPTSRIIFPDDEPDAMTSAMLNSLSRPIYYQLSWGVALSFLFTIVSFGVAPVVMPPMWLRGLIAQHAQQLWHVGEWLRLQTGDPDAASIQKAADRVRFNWFLAALAWIFAAIAMIFLTLQFSPRPFDIRPVVSFAFHLPDTISRVLFSLAITLAAACNWLHLNWHQRNVAGAIECFNRLANKHRWPVVSAARVGFGLMPLWIIGGIIISASGAVWALPVMLAAGAHRRYTIRDSVLMRETLAERLRDLLQQRRPAVRVPTPIKTIRTCVRTECRAGLTTEASFCPRCGAAA